MMHLKEILKEFLAFFKANLYSAIYGILFVIIIILSNTIQLGTLSKHDSIFVIIILLQIFLLVCKIESKKDFAVIMVFHIIATVMELFKTSHAIGSWQYPGVEESIFKIYNVPLFTGFMYSAVGSYISRAQDYLQLTYRNYPNRTYVLILCVVIYLNFFLHHYIYDLRYIILCIIVILFFHTRVEYKVYKKVRSMHFLMTAFLTSVMIWFAENISTFYKIWLYPNQIHSWEWVSLSKITSWFLLLIVSFGVISTLKNFRMK